MGRGFAITEYTWVGCFCTYSVTRTRHGRPWRVLFTWDDGDKCHGKALPDVHNTPTSAQSVCYRHDRECEAVQAALTFGVAWMRGAEELLRAMRADVDESMRRSMEGSTR